MIDERMLTSLDNEPDFRPAPIVKLGPDDIPVVIEDVPGQGSASELPDHALLPERYKDLYIRVDLSGKNQHWGKPKLVERMIDTAYNWWAGGNKPVCLITDLSRKRFKDTTGHKTHKTGEDGDFDLARTLPRDGKFTRAKRAKCVKFMKCCLEAGFSRVLFTDQDAVDTVNAWAKLNGIPGRAKYAEGHDNHFHVDL